MYEPVVKLTVASHRVSVCRDTSQFYRSVSIIYRELQHPMRIWQDGN